MCLFFRDLFLKAIKLIEKKAKAKEEKTKIHKASCKE